MEWHVKFTAKSKKEARLLGEHEFESLRLLFIDLQNNGPIPGQHWSHYGKLRGKRTEDKRHCHIVNGRPTYVCCWEVFKFKKLIKVYYVGTHEKAPY